MKNEENGRKEENKNQKYSEKKKNKLDKKLKQEAEVKVENEVEPAEKVIENKENDDITKGKRKIEVQPIPENKKVIKEKVKKERAARKDEKKEKRAKREVDEAVVETPDSEGTEEVIEGCSENTSEQYKGKESCDTCNQQKAPIQQEVEDEETVE